MSPRVTRQPRARQDIIEQALWIAGNNPQAAERFLAAVEQAERVLADLPEPGVVRPVGRLKDIRVWPVRGFEKHLIFYRPLKDGIEAIRLLHASRDIGALFAS